LIILDLGLPDGNGEGLLRDLRQRGDATPVIILTSRDAEVERVVGLELGADDYVTKPFSPREVVARVKAVLRRSDAPTTTEPRVAAGGLQIDIDKRRARFDGADLDLTRLELDLLHTLLQRPVHVFTRTALLDRLWADVHVTDRTVDVHIKSLRKKLRDAGGDPDVIETVRGVGYRARE